MLDGRRGRGKEGEMEREGDIGKYSLTHNEIISRRKGKTKERKGRNGKASFE